MRQSELLPVSAVGSSQACDTYGIHYKLPHLQELYNNGEASFVAGIGVLTSPVTKSNYESETVTQLFAHDKSKYHTWKYSMFAFRFTDMLNGIICFVALSSARGNNEA